MNRLEKIKLIYNLNGFIPVILKTWSLVFLVKYVNMTLDMSQLSTAKIAVGALTIIVLKYAQKDCILDWLGQHLNIVYTIYSTINIGVLSTLWINPWWYVILEAIQIASINEIIQSSFDDVLNDIYRGRQKTKWSNTWRQTKCIGAFLGGLLGLVFNDINLNIALGIIISTYIIILPGNYYLFKLIKEERNSK